MLKASGREVRLSLSTDRHNHRGQPPAHQQIVAANRHCCRPCRKDERRNPWLHAPRYIVVCCVQVDLFLLLDVPDATCEQRVLGRAEAAKVAGKEPRKDDTSEVGCRVHALPPPRLITGYPTRCVLVDHPLPIAIGSDHWVPSVLSALLASPLSPLPLLLPFVSISAVLVRRCGGRPLVCQQPLVAARGECRSVVGRSTLVAGDPQAIAGVP